MSSHYIQALKIALFTTFLGLSISLLDLGTTQDTPNNARQLEDRVYICVLQYLSTEFYTDSYKVLELFL